MTTYTASNRPMKVTRDARTLLRECFRSFCVDPADSEYQLGYVACALDLWDDMQLGNDSHRVEAALTNGLSELYINNPPPNRPIQPSLDARTLLCECFRGYCVDLADTDYQLGFLACALSL